MEIKDLLVSLTEETFLTDLTPIQILEGSKKYVPEHDFFTFKIRDALKLSENFLDVFLDLYGEAMGETYGENKVYGNVEAYHKTILDNLINVGSIIPFIALATSITSNIKYYGSVVIKPGEKDVQLDKFGNPVYGGWFDYAVGYDIIGEMAQSTFYYLFKYSTELLGRKFKEDEKEHDFTFSIEEETFGVCLDGYLTEFYYMGDFYNRLLDITSDLLSAYNNQLHYLTGYYLDIPKNRLTLILEK